MKPNIPLLIYPLMALAGWLFVRAANSESRSKKFGSAAMGCGVAGFIPGLLPSYFRDPTQLQEVTVCGVFTLLFALAAVLLSLRTFYVRRHDRAVQLFLPVGALLLGLLNTALGAALLIAGSGSLAPAEGTVSTWRSERDGFEVTIPTELWRRKPESNPEFRAEFVCGKPSLLAYVQPPFVAGTDSEYEEVLAHGRQLRDGLPGASNLHERSGKNGAGHDYWVFWADAMSATGEPFFFGVSITRIENKAVILMFEGHYRTISESGRALESHAFRKQAELFLGSVKRITGP